MGYGGDPKYIQALNDVVVALMVEKKGAVENLEEILSLGGIDMVQWGPSDYSMSTGMSKSDPQIKAVEKYVIETALKMGVPPRAEINSPDQAKYYLDMGVKHFSLNTEIVILFNWLKENGAELLKVIESA
jgi:4-hydroxy-2-oxoheptanedioate aldolase